MLASLKSLKLGCQPSVCQTRKNVVGFTTPPLVLCSAGLSLGPLVVYRVVKFKVDTLVSDAQAISTNLDAPVLHDNSADQIFLSQFSFRSMLKKKAHHYPITFTRIAVKMEMASIISFENKSNGMCILNLSNRSFPIYKIIE